VSKEATHWSVLSLIPPDYLEGKAQSEFERCQTVEPPLRPTPWFRSLYYRTLDSWSRYRRVVCKLTYDADGTKRRLVVTSLPAHQVIPSSLYTDYYCPRGDRENRIKEHQLDLFSNRTSTHTFDANQLRLWFSSLAYVSNASTAATLPEPN